MPFNQVMEPASTFFKEEKDPYYIKGFKKGAEKERIKASSEFAERLILATDYTNEVIAVLAGVTIAFVKAKRRAVVKKSRLKK